MLPFCFFVIYLNYNFNKKKGDKVARRKSLLNVLLGGSSHRRRKKGFIEILLDGQKRTEKRNNSHEGVMCSGPRSSKRKKSIFF